MRYVNKPSSQPVCVNLLRYLITIYLARQVEGISELRIRFGPGYRIYFQRRTKSVIVLLCGGDKSSQAKDIKLAKRLGDELE